MNTWPPYFTQEATEVPHADSLIVYNKPETDPNKVEVTGTHHTYGSFQPHVCRSLCLTQ